jgi:homopolymeric O-antigen transport system permease protein
MAIGSQVEAEGEQVPGAEGPPAPACHEVTVICPPSGWQLINVREIWKHRELFYFLAWRDVKIRYKQTLLGAAWAVIQPALMMVVFTIFFGRIAGVSSGGLPYPVFVYAGLLPWTFFSTAVSQAGNSVIGSERLITKIYFPRLVIPFAAVGAAIVDFAVALGLLVILMAYYRIAPGIGLLLVPVLFALITLVALGVGTLLAALNVAYRDFRYVIPFLIQIWLFATPTVYMDLPGGDLDHVQAQAVTKDKRVETAPASEAASSSPKEGAEGYVKAVLALNPMSPLIASFRAATLGGRIPWGQLGLASAASVVAFLLGCLYFRRVEDGFADIV